MNPEKLQQVPLDKQLLKRLAELEEKVALLEERIANIHKAVVSLKTSDSIHHGVYR